MGDHDGSGYLTGCVIWIGGPSPKIICVLAIVAVAAVLPYTPLGNLLRFTPLPLTLLGAIALLAVTYLLLVQAVKSWFYRRHALL